METLRVRTYGPLATIHIKLLQTQLDKVGSKYRIFSDEELLRRAQIRPKGSPEASPMMHNSPQIILKEFLFIEIPLEDILVVRQTLLQLGYEQSIDTQTAETLDHEEFVCPRCDYLQFQPGYCPKHHLLLIPYFERLKKSALFGSRLGSQVGILIIVLMLILILINLFN